MSCRFIHFFMPDRISLNCLASCRKHERRFGSFERSLRPSDGVDAGKIEATFAKGVLTVTLPKTSEAEKAEKKIAVKAAA
jgi:HSP20 family molecular chaperone IbpA